MAHKYKEGDKVRVRTDLKHQVYWMADGNESNSFVDEMKKFAGKVVTLVYKGKQYGIEEDNGQWGWVDEMFSGLVAGEEPTPKPEPSPLPGPAFKVGDKVRVRSDLSDAICWYDDELGRSNSCGCVHAMLEQAGKIVTIAEVHNNPHEIHYSIKEDSWNWVYGEFDGLVDATPEQPDTEPLHTDWNWEDLF